jgi:L-asparagine transporter-like permease
MSWLIGYSYAIPLVAFRFYGVESIAVTAFEAQYSTSLKIPSKIIAYAVFIFYFMCTIGEALTARWTSPYLPPIFGVDGTNSTSSPRSSNWVVNVTLSAGYNRLAGFLNGCFIFSVLSTSNTALYICSRTLYGIGMEIPATNVLGKALSSLSLVVRQSGVPAAALCFSAVALLWLPFLHLKRGYAIEDVCCNHFPLVVQTDLSAPVDRNHVDFRKYCLFDCLVCIMLSIYPIWAMVKKTSFGFILGTKRWSVAKVENMRRHH